MGQGNVPFDPKRAEAPAMESGQRDELAASLSELFTNVSLIVRGELQEYSNYGDVAAGLRVYVEQLNEKNQGFDEYISQIEVTEFEAVVSLPITLLPPNNSSPTENMS